MMSSRRYMLLPVVVSFAIFVCMLAGCTATDDPQNEPLSTGVSATAEESPASDADSDGVDDAADDCPRGAEDARWSDGSDGCPDTLDDLMAFAASDMDTFWETTMEAVPLPYQSPEGVTGYDSAIETECGEAVPMNAFYCPLDHAIYFDQSLAEGLLSQIGDFGPVFVLAHEWGHLVQANVGLLGTGAFTIQVELQADCLAGAYVQDAGARRLLERGDLDEAAQTLFISGDPAGTPWYDPRAHGTADERFGAFVLGYQEGVLGCLG